MEHNKVIDLIYLAKQAGVEIVLNNERLQLKIPENQNIDNHLLEEIKKNKLALIEFLSNENWQAKKITDNRKRINKVSEDIRPKNIPLSYAQERLWFIHQLSGSVQYHSPVVLRLKGKLNAEALESALKSITCRHEVLRTVFLDQEGEPYQYIRDNKDWTLHIVDGKNYGIDPDGLRSYIESLIQTPFDLSKDYMLRAHLIRMEEDEHVVVVVMHHIASDAWSMPIIINEVATLYRAYTNGEGNSLPALAIQYADYAIWERSYLTPEVLDEKINYWTNKLDGVLPLSLPTDFARPPIRTTLGAAANFKLSKELLAQLHKLSQQEGVSLFMTLLAAFKVLLFRYSGQTDISVGTSIANRTQQEVEGLIGFFVNTLTFRDEVKGDEDFIALLQQVSETTLGAYKHQEVPFERVVERVVKERDPAINPLFQVMLVLQNTPDAPRLQLGDLTLASESYEHTISKFDLTFFISEGSSGLHGMVQYRTDLFKAATIERMMSHFVNLLGSIVKDPRQQVGALSMLSSREEQQLLSGFNVSKAVYPQQKTIVDLFEEQALKTPDATAIVYEEETLTYGQLNTKANHLAHYLKQKGVKEDVLVPICIDRSTQLIIGILGILKSGGAYVPIDTDFPGDRISYMLQDSGSSMVLSDQNSRSKIEMADADANIIDIEDIAIQLQPGLNPQRSLRATHLAYVIYTSGSTGKPKGVMIEHRSLVDYVYGLKEKIQVDQSRSYALVSSIATDLGNTVIYSSLVFGGALHLFSKEAVSNIDYLHNYFSNHTIDCLKIVPSHWKALRLDGQLLLPSKLLVFGGEALHKEVYEEIKMSGTLCKVVNHYGPTETTIGKLLHITDSNVTYNSTIPIGQPFSNTAVYVLSKEMQLVPVGIPGQLYIAGHGVARGYLNNIELTKEKFIENTFSNDEDKRLMYATGDMVKYVADGQIEFIGRIDNQVKIRGYRIELGEIESTLQQCDLVSHAAVLTKEDRQGNNRLIAYIVANGWYNREGITKYLKEHLPEYMVPALLVEMEMLPLTANGKIDRKGLPDPDATEILSNQYVGPRNEVEQKLATIWQNILEVEQVGVHDDFFELGGHSLLAVRLISAIRKELSVEMPISDIFDYTTVAQLAEQLTAQSGTIILPSIEVVQPRPGRIPLSFSQERLWFIHQLEGSIQYHVPAVLNLKGSINVEALEFAIKTIVNRHEVLRTVILQNEGEPYQYIKEKDLWQLTVIDGSAYKEDRHGLHQYIQQLINSPFDLSKDDMIRGHLVTLDVNNSVLLVNLHHIASDGWSRGILVKELAELYKAYAEGASASLAPLPLQYADYAIWQRNYLQGDVLEKKINYWQEQLHGVEPLQLPTDYARPAVQSTKGASVGFKIEKELAEQLQLLSHQHNTTLFMTLLAVFKVLLYRYTGQQDICVGSGVAGRQQQEVEGLIGFFINMLALRSHVDGQLPFIEFLHQVRSTTMEAFKRQDVPFEKVVNAVSTERDMSRSPVFQAMFVLQNTPELQHLELGELQISSIGSEHENAKFEIVLSLTETSSGLIGSFGYMTDLYSQDTIGRMLIHFKELLISAIQAPQQKLASLSMLTQIEESDLLKFNKLEISYPKEKTIVDLFDEQVKKTPNSIAAIFNDDEISYNDLNEKSIQLADFLQKKGVKAETLVPICLEPGFDMLVGILGILKVGGAYVPIDPDYPLDRIKYILEDTAACLVISNKKSSGKLLHADVEVINMDDNWSQIALASVKDLNNIVLPQQLAYIIYTSGSTGKPKGVMVEHQNVVRLFKSNAPIYDFNETDVWTLFHSFSFDFSVWEIFGALLFGGKLVILPKEVTRDTSMFLELLSRHKVTVLNQTPSAFYVLQDYLIEKSIEIHVRYVIFGGEALTLSKLEPWKQKYASCKLVNMYGITETTVHVTYQEIDWHHIANGSSIIGRPIPTLSCYILDENRNIVPIGVPGELYVGGAGVARGYLNRAELTTERFIENPYSEEIAARLYRTGDRGRWLSDGSIEYLGRIDDQVKIRGHRIELGEIESVLQKSGLVQECVILAKNDRNGNKRLVGYVVFAQSHTKESVTSYLHDMLPEYMVPALWVTLERLPLTSNGKVDKKSLPDIDMNTVSSGDYIAPRNEIELKLAETWQQVLGIEQVSVEDNFFELGGDSILTIQVVSQVRRKGYELQPKDLFLYQTIEGLAKLIARRAVVAIQGEQGILKGDCGLLPIQEWYLNEGNEDISHFNQSVLLGVRKTITETVLKDAVGQLIAYHDALRFKYKKDGSEWLQSFGQSEGGLTVEDLRLVAKEDLRSEIEKNSERYQRSLNIEKGAVVRVVLMQTPAEEPLNRLLIVVHHLSIDGVSWRILLDHLEEIINSQESSRKISIGNKGSSYRQWYNALRQYGQSEKLLSQKDYWNNIVQSRYPIPVDHICLNKVKQVDTGVYRVSLSQGYTQGLLQEVPKVYQTEINDVLLSALSKTLCEWIGSDQIIIGLEGHGREDILEGIDTTRTVGWFTTLYPVLLGGDISKGEGNWLKATKKQLQAIPDKGLGYGVLKYINKEVSLQGNDPWEITFNYLGQLDNIIQKNSVLQKAGESSGLNIGDKNVFRDKLSFNGVIRGGQLTTSWRYSTKHFDGQTIKVIAENYISNLQILINHCTEQLKARNVAHANAVISNVQEREKNNSFKQDDSQFLIPIKKGNGKLPLYIVCGGGGTVLKFKKMVALLDKDQRVFGLQQPTDLKYVAEFPETVEEIAEKYISEILLENPEGPYALAGHCSGGIIAYEMSRQLEAMQKKVDLLIMFDTVIPSKNERTVQPANVKNLYNLRSAIKKANLKFQSKARFQFFILRKHSKDLVYYKINRIKNIFKKAYSKSEELKVYEVYDRLTKMIEKAARSYNVKKYNRNIIVCYAKDHYSFYDSSRNVSYLRFDLDDSTKNRWKNFTETYEIHEIEGEHSTMFDPIDGGGKALAALLQSKLDACIELKQLHRNEKITRS